MSVHVDAVEGLGGMNPSRTTAEASLPPESSQTQRGTVKRWRGRFMNSRLGKLAAAVFLSGLATGISVTSSGGIEKPVSRDNSDASKVPPVPTMMAGNLPDSGSSELGSPSAEKQEFSKDQQDFIEIMSGIMAPNVVGEIKDAFSGRGASPKQFTVSDSPAGKSYIFQFPESLPIKPGLAMIDVTLLNKDSRLVWHAQTQDQNLSPEFPNQRSEAVVRSEEELARKVENILAQRYKSQKLIFYSDPYNYKVGVQFSTSDGGEEWWGASANIKIDDIVPGCIYLGGEMIPPHNSVWRIDPPNASGGKPDPLQRIPR